MYNTYAPYPCSYYRNTPYPCPYYGNTPNYNPNFSNEFINQYTRFYGEMEYTPEPFVVNIEKATKQNNTYRTVLWTGTYLQLTLMSIEVGEDIGLEVHENLDQFIRIEEGQGLVKMGDSKNNLDFQRKVDDDFAFIIPAGKWHNLINTGNKPIKLYSIYAPPEHPHGTVHETKAIAEAAENNQHY